MIWAEDRCGQLWCDQSLPGCRPIVDHGFYEVIHWERHEHRVSNQNGTRESHTGALLLCAVISCSFHLSLPLTLCQKQFLFWLVYFIKPVMYEWQKGKENLVSHYRLSFYGSIKDFGGRAGGGAGDMILTSFFI